MQCNECPLHSIWKYQNPDDTSDFYYGCTYKENTIRVDDYPNPPGDCPLNGIPEKNIFED